MANLITLLRFLLLFLLVAMAYWASPHLQMINAPLLVLIIALDGLDGWVARRRGETSVFGSIFDIAVDRVVENVLWIVLGDLGLDPDLGRDRLHRPWRHRRCHPLRRHLSRRNRFRHDANAARPNLGRRPLDARRLRRREGGDVRLGADAAAVADALPGGLGGLVADVALGHDGAGADLGRLLPGPRTAGNRRVRGRPEGVRPAADQRRRSVEEPVIGRLVRLWRAATLANARRSESHLIHARWGELRARHVRLKSQLSLAYVSPAGRVASYQVIRKIRVSAVWRTVFARLGQVMETAVRKEMPALFWAIVALVVLLPLPLGAVYQWSWGVMASVVGDRPGGVERARRTRPAGRGIRHAPRLAAGGRFGLVVVWIMLQVQSFTPAGWHHPLWSTTAEVLGERDYSAISLNPFDTLSGLVRLLAYAGIFWIALQYCRRAPRARQVLLAVVYGGLAYALYGVAVHLTGSDVHSDLQHDGRPRMT